tara:strand:- start:3900 stop:4061 length:162 start_codon:yes stop_codon:yes gene_type:complete
VYQLQRAEKKVKDEPITELKKLEIEWVALNNNKTKLEQNITELNKVREAQQMT